MILFFMWSQNLSAEELEKIPHFYMPAGLCYEKMSFPDKLMMKTAAAFMKRSVKKKQEKTEMDLAVGKRSKCLPTCRERLR